MLFQAGIRRPLGARDKSIRLGMRLFFDGRGNMVARWQAPWGGGTCVGHVISCDEPDKRAVDRQCVVALQPYLVSFR